jgi:Putative lumazine-binding
MHYVIVAIMMILIWIPTVPADSGIDISSIKKTATTYMNAWYQGDTRGMKTSLHKKLAKRSLKGMMGENELRHTTASDMISYTQSGYGKHLWHKDLKIDVVVLDYFKDIASVKVTTPHYYEYLHIAKIEGKWVILNALYEKNSRPQD